MALALCLTLLPATALAEDGHAPHCLCGAEHTSIGDHKESTEITFDKWLASSVSSGKRKLLVGGTGQSIYGDGIDLDSNDKYVLSSGEYYLKTGNSSDFEANVKVDHPIQITGIVTICLNGQTIESDAKGMPVFEVASGGKLTLTDCRYNKGKVTHFFDGTGCGVEVNGGEFNLYGGTITGNTAPHGGGVYVSGGTFNMYGEATSVSNNTATNDKKTGTGGGVYVADGIFTMNGGTISGNTADLTDGGVGVYTTTDSTTATFTMNGGEITRNSANYGGGVGVYRAANFTMNGSASITDNTANPGGGVYVDAKCVHKGVNMADATFTMNNTASVSGNTANQGGGVYVERGTFDMNDGTISGNKAKNEKASNDTNGGGVYVKGGKFEMNGPETSVSGNTATTNGGVYVEGGTFTMNDGTIGGTIEGAANTANQDGGGVNAAGGKFNMNGGRITGNHNNGVFVHPSATFTVSGAPTVIENTRKGVASNVFLAGYQRTITIGKVGLNGRAESIGVTIPYPEENSVIATNANGDYSGIFFIDDKQYVVKHDTAHNNLVLAKRDGTTTPTTHKHEWTYTATGAIITATCKGEGCDVSGSVAITKPANLTYDGTKKLAMVEESENWKSVYSQDITITYWESVDGSDTYTNMKGDAPTKVGKYKASITVGGKTASVEYEITDSSAPAEKTDPTYTAPTAKSGLVYTGENQSLIDPGSTNHGRMWYKRGTDDVYSTLVPMAKDAGSYTVYYKVEGDATHNDVAEKSIEVRIEKAQLSGTPTFTKVTEAGKTLKDVTLTKPESWPDGKFEWGNGVLGYLEDKPLVQGKAYSWLYLADNYYAEGTVVLWADPSSSGGGSSGSYDSNPIVKTETKNNPDGSTTKTETRRDGSVTQTTTAKDGSTGTVKTDKHGQTEAKTALSNKAVEDAKRNGEAVKAPVEVEASRNSSTAPTVKVELPKGAGETKVEIPVSNVKSGTVAVLVHPDGTEEILKNSIPTEDGIQLTVDGNATVKIIDNSKDFIDTRNHWAREEIDFVSARELVNGMSDTIYAPNNSATRAQLWTILARQADADLTGGNTWYEKAQLWSKDKGISDGTEPNAAINRAQMVTMLWRTMGQPAATDKVSFADVPAGSYYAQAVAWAVESGITTGVGGGRFDPAATCTRAQIAAFLTRLYAEK